MWLLIMFDLPVNNKKLKKSYTQFRKVLMKNGFYKMQYSVYIRNCIGIENTNTHYRRIKEVLPEQGEVRIFIFTDKQFGKMKVFNKNKQIHPEKPIEQLLLL